MFFLADDDRYYRLSAIESWRRSVGKAGTEAIVLMNDGTGLQVSNHALKFLDIAGSSSVPAQADTYFVGLVDEGDSKAIYLKPIIAWLILADSAPLPVTSGGIDDGVTNDYAILLPNGQVDSPYADLHQNLQDFLVESKFAQADIDEALKLARNITGREQGSEATKSAHARII